MTNRELMKTNKLNSTQELLLKLIKFILKERRLDVIYMEHAKVFGDELFVGITDANIFRKDLFINNIYDEINKLKLCKEDKQTVYLSKMNYDKIHNNIDDEYTELISRLQFRGEDND